MPEEPWRWSWIPRWVIGRSLSSASRGVLCGLSYSQGSTCLRRASLGSLSRVRAIAPCPPPHSAIDLAAIRQEVLARFPMVNDHPDVAGVLRDPKLLALIGPGLAAPFVGDAVNKVLAPEARGPILGGLVAASLGAGLILARKDERNHPGADLRIASQPTWRGTAETFQLRSFDIQPHDRVLVVDDWLTTGSTVDAVLSVVRGQGAFVVGVAVLVSKASDEVVGRVQPHVLVDFERLMRSSHSRDRITNEE